MQDTGPRSRIGHPGIGVCKKYTREGLWKVLHLDKGRAYKQTYSGLSWNKAHALRAFIIGQSECRFNEITPADYAPETKQSLHRLSCLQLMVTFHSPFRWTAPVHYCSNRSEPRHTCERPIHRFWTTRFRSHFSPPLGV